MTYKLLKFLHLIGLTLFLGSVFGHVASGILGGAVNAGPDFASAREHILFTTRVLTIPGLLLAILTGIGLAILSGQVKRRSRWFMAHALLGLAVLAVAAVFVVPSGQEIMPLLPGLDTNAAAARSAIESHKLVEDISGAVNVLLTLAIVALGVAKPRLGRG